MVRALPCFWDDLGGWGWTRKAGGAGPLLTRSAYDALTSGRGADRTRSPPADKTIKLWKVFEKSLKVVAENNGSVSTANLPGAGAPPSPPHAASPLPLSNSLFPSAPRPTTTANGVPLFRLPRMTYHDTIVAAVPRKVYANAHAYHINSISINSDGETYMSADDLRVNLWNLNISDQSFSTSLPPLMAL
jgi:hypothetical protein